MPIAIYDKSSQRRLFEVTQEELQALIDVLEEEDEGDHDYYVDAAVCDFLDGRVDAKVVQKLRDALGASGKQSKAVTDPGVEAAPDDDDLPELGHDEDLEQDGIEIEWRTE